MYPEQPKSRRVLLYLFSVVIVLFAHAALAFTFLVTDPKPPSLSTNIALQMDMTEGARKVEEEIIYFNVDDLIPTPEVTAVEDEKEPDLPPVKEEEKKPEEKPEEKKPEPKPIEKPKPKKKPKVEKKKPERKPRVKETRSAEGSNIATGATGTGADRTSGGNSEVGYSYNPKPEYPATSIERREEGVVTLIMDIEADGRPTNVRVLVSSGYKRLDASALKTVSKKHRFTPKKVFGKPVRQAGYQLTIGFVIDEYLR